MGFNIETYQNRYAFTFESQHIGRIRIWPATSASALSALSDHSLRSKNTSTDFMLVLLSVTAAQENSQNPRHKEDAFLPPEDLSLLSDDELEKIAEQFLAHHTYLFDDHSRLAYESLPGKDGSGDLVEVKCETIALPRQAGESNADYLRRLVENYCKTQKEATQKAMAGISEGFSKMVPDFSALAKLNSSIGDSISEAMDSIRVGFQAGTEMAALAPHILPPPNPQHKTNDILADIESILFQQKEINIEMTRHIQQLTPVAEKWEEAANKSTRLNWISISIASVAAIAAILALIVAYLTYKATLSQ